MLMTVDDRWIAGVNDRRLARIEDQMGIMFMWQTPDGKGVVDLGSWLTDLIPERNCALVHIVRSTEE